MIQTDCFAYKNNGEKEYCYALNDLYCKNKKCKFYRNDIVIEQLEHDAKKYIKEGNMKNKESKEN